MLMIWHRYEVMRSARASSSKWYIRQGRAREYQWSENINARASTGTCRVLLTFCQWCCAPTYSFPSGLESLSTFFPSCDMADYPTSALFSARFESALQAYQHTTGVTLAEHSLTVQFQNPHSAESIAAILKCEARVPSDLQESDTIVNSIENIVSMLFSISTSTSFRNAIVLVH